MYVVFVCNQKHQIPTGTEVIGSCKPPAVCARARPWSSARIVPTCNRWTTCQPLLACCKIGFHSAEQADLELVVMYLFQSSECSDYRCEAPCLTFSFPFLSLFLFLRLHLEKLPRLVLNSQYSDLGQPRAGLQEWPPLLALSVSSVIWLCSLPPVALANVCSSKGQIFNIL